MAIFSIKQVSDLLNVHPKTVRLWIHQNILEAIRLPGSWRIHSEALQRFTQAKTKARQNDFPERDI
jgi:excisionase family DNA binding protein